MIERRYPIQTVLANRKMFAGGGVVSPQQTAAPVQPSMGILSSSSPLMEAVAADALNPAGGSTMLEAPEFNEGGAVRSYRHGGFHADRSAEGFTVDEMAQQELDQPTGDERFRRKQRDVWRRRFLNGPRDSRKYGDMTELQYRRMLESIKDAPFLDEYFTGGRRANRIPLRFNPGEEQSLIRRSSAGDAAQDILNYKEHYSDVFTPEEYFEYLALLEEGRFDEAEVMRLKEIKSRFFMTDRSDSKRKQVEAALSAAEERVRTADQPTTLAEMRKRILERDPNAFMGRGVVPEGSPTVPVSGGVGTAASQPPVVPDLYPTPVVPDLYPKTLAVQTRPPPVGQPPDSPFAGQPPVVETAAGQPPVDSEGRKLLDEVRRQSSRENLVGRGGLLPRDDAAAAAAGFSVSDQDIAAEMVGTPRLPVASTSGPTGAEIIASKFPGAPPPPITVSDIQRRIAESLRRNEEIRQNKYYGRPASPDQIDAAAAGFDVNETDIAAEMVAETPAEILEKTIQTPVVEVETAKPFEFMAELGRAPTIGAYTPAAVAGTIDPYFPGELKSVTDKDPYLPGQDLPHSPMTSSKIGLEMSDDDEFREPGRAPTEAEAEFNFAGATGAGPGDDLFAEAFPTTLEIANSGDSNDTTVVLKSDVYNELVRKGPRADPGVKLSTLDDAVETAAKVAQGDKTTDISSLQKQLEALMPAVEEDSSMEGLLVAMLGLTIAGGQDPSALKNFSEGAQKSLPALINYRAKLKSDKRAQQTAVAKMAIQQKLALDAEQRAEDRIIRKEDRAALRKKLETSQYMTIKGKTIPAAKINPGAEGFITIPKMMPVTLDQYGVDRFQSLEIPIIEVGKTTLKLDDILDKSNTIDLSQIDAKTLNRYYTKPKGPGYAPFKQFGENFRYNYMEPTFAGLVKLGRKAKNIITSGQAKSLHRAYTKSAKNYGRMYESLEKLNQLAQTNKLVGTGSIAEQIGSSLKGLTGARFLKGFGVDKFADMLLEGKDVSVRDSFTAKGRLLLAKMAPIILGESGKTISDADRVRVARSLGFEVDSEIIDGEVVFKGITGFDGRILQNPKTVMVAIRETANLIRDRYELIHMTYQQEMDKFDVNVPDLKPFAPFKREKSPRLTFDLRAKK